MIMMTLVLRILSSSWIAVLQKILGKRGWDSIAVVALVLTCLAVLLLPGLYWFPYNKLSAAFWLSILLVAVLDTPGHVLLVKSVKLTDLSLIGPLSAYKPVVGLLLGIFFLEEVPTKAGLAGVLVILTGSMLLSPGGVRPGIKAFSMLLSDKGIQFRLLSLILTAGASIFSKQAVLLSTVGHTFMGWAFLGAPMAMVAWFILRGPSEGGKSKTEGKDVLLFSGLVMLFFPLQIFTLILFARMNVGYALALFQLSGLVNVLFGYKLFAEKHVFERSMACLVMIFGATLIILWG